MVAVRGLVAHIVRTRSSFLPRGDAMQTENKFFDDFARLAGGAFNAFGAFKTELESQMRQQVEALLARMKLVTREEFEAVQAMAAKAREEQEALAKRVAALESKLGIAAAPGGQTSTEAEPLDGDETR